MEYIVKSILIDAGVADYLSCLLHNTGNNYYLVKVKVCDSIVLYILLSLCILELKQVISYCEQCDNNITQGHRISLLGSSHTMSIVTINK